VIETENIPKKAETSPIKHSKRSKLVKFTLGGAALLRVEAAMQKEGFESLGLYCKHICCDAPVNAAIPTIRAWLKATKELEASLLGVE
jgi:hypothetical protein